MKIQPLGQIFGISFHLGHVLLAVVVIVSWAIFYLQLQKPMIDLVDQDGVVAPPAWASPAAAPSSPSAP